MTQPTDRLSDVPPAGELDLERGEFWIENPWRMTTRALNASAYEPNQVFLNVADGFFAEIGYLAGADSAGDGRGVMVADVTGDLQPDLLVRQMLPTTNFASSQSAEVRFGLGRAQAVDRLTVRWPSGTVQELRSVPVGAHIRITEGEPEFEVLWRAGS